MTSLHTARRRLSQDLEIAVRQNAWVRQFSAAITVCDSRGILVAMNDRAAASFRAQSGKRLIGSNVMDCHPEAMRRKLQTLLENQQTNVYTTEKGGKKQLIYQSPWYHNGEFGGLIEIVLDLPAEMPHFVRD